MKYYSTNNKDNLVDFKTAVLTGMPDDYGLYMMARQDIPHVSQDELIAMREMNYAEIAFLILHKFLKNEIPEADLKNILDDAYCEKIIPTRIQKLDERIHIMWLSAGPTYSFKDYAARFLGRVLNYFLTQEKLKRTVVVATSGDTGGAVASALHNLDNVNNIVFFPRESISPEQRRQMTTLRNNVYAFAVNGDFDVCQALAKHLLDDKEFAQNIFGDRERITSANSISLARLLPQIVYPFFAYSRMAENMEKIIPNIPSGNFGDMMGTVIAREMGLPIQRIICAVNENKEFPEFLATGKYRVEKSIHSPSSAMIVSHPSNLARLIDFYGGHIYDERDAQSKKIIRAGIINRMPDMGAMRDDLFSVSINNPDHYLGIKEVYDQYQTIIEPHGAVGWRALAAYDAAHPEDQKFKQVIYETADPGKFPDEVERAISVRPEIPPNIQAQSNLAERIYTIDAPSDNTESGLKLSATQIQEAKQKIGELKF